MSTHFKNHIATALFLCLLLGACGARASSFQLKSLSIGATAASACGTSVVTDHFGDIVTKYKADVPTLVDLHTTECEVDFQSFGGSSLARPAQLLFLDGSLILVKLELVSLPLTNFVDILRTLTADYGKAVRLKSPPFVTDTWRRNGQTLVLERLGREWDDNDVTVILRQDSGYRTYEARFKANSDALKKLSAKKIKDDIR